MSAHTLVLLLGHPGRWLRIEDGNVVERGKGLPGAPFADDEARIVGIVAAHDVVIHHAHLPDLTDAQARGAARLTVAENSMTPVEALHVATGSDVDGERTIVAMGALEMAQYLADLTAQGFDPHAMLAAPLVLPRPETGFVSADLGGEIIVRGRDAAFADDPVLTPLLAPGEIVVLDRAAIEAALVAAAANPEVDLRQGPFARRRRWAVDRSRLRLIGWLAAACAATLLILPLVMLIHLSVTASRIEAQSIATAQAALPPGTAVLNPLAQLDERLAAVGGAGGGFVPLAAAVGNAANATANVELGTMNFDSDGSLRVGVRATGPAELTAFETRLAAAGVAVLPGPIVAGLGRPTRDYTVRAR